MKNEQLVYDAIKTLSDSESNRPAIELLRQFLLSNQTQKLGKFNIYNYVSKDKFRPNLQGVYYSDGYSVATDSMILVALRSKDYPSDIEGQIIDKKGKKIDGFFPDWKKVLQQKDNANYSCIIDRDVIVDAANKYKQFQKEKKEGIFCVKVGDIYFNPLYLIKLVDFATHIGAEKIYVHKNRYDFGSCSVYGVDGSIGLLSSMRITDTEKTFSINI